MSWIFLLFLIPLVLFMVVLGRVIRVARTLRHPERLRSLLSEHVHAAILEAGLDPDPFSMEEIQESEELKSLVAADLRRVIRSLFLGRPRHESDVSPAADRFRVHRDSDIPLQRWRSHPVSGQSGQSFIPPPIDHASGSGMRVMVVLVIIGLTAAAVFVVSSQP